MTPKCCEGCQYLKGDGYCSPYKNCQKWRKWFSKEWRRIRMALTRDEKQRELLREKEEAEDRDRYDKRGAKNL